MGGGLPRGIVRECGEDGSKGVGAGPSRGMTRTAGSMRAGLPLAAEDIPQYGPCGSCFNGLGGAG